MSYLLYVIGFVIVIGGLSYGAFLLHVAPRWIAVMDIVLLGLGILTGATRTRRRDPSE
jgi:CHASE2 domain-containing sensor protein